MQNCILIGACDPELKRNKPARIKALAVAPWWPAKVLQANKALANEAMRTADYFDWGKYPGRSEDLGTLKNAAASLSRGNDSIKETFYDLKQITR